MPHPQSSPSGDLAAGDPPSGTVVGVLTRATRSLRSGDLGRGLGAAVLLAVPDLLRQLPVRTDPSRLHAFVVDVLGVLSATVAQVALVGLLAGSPLLRGGAALVIEAVRRRPGTVLAALAAAGVVSALLTLLPSVLLLGYPQVVGPLDGAPVSRLLLAQVSDVVATATTAPWFAVVVLVLTGRR